MEHDLWDYAGTYEWMERARKFPPMVVTVAVNGGVQPENLLTMIRELPADSLFSVIAWASPSGRS